MVAKTIFGLEEILAKELADLGAQNIRTANRSVTFDGDKEILYKANLCLRTAGRVLVPLTTCKILKPDDLYKATRTVNWLDYLKADGRMIIDSVVNFNKSFKNSMYAAQLTKDAIVDQIRAKTGKRPSIDNTKPDIRINLHINKTDCSIALDSSGDPLNKRGYRTERTLAPLNECLAAGILKLCCYDGSRPLIDPMCGSGTFAIEAAMIALNKAPGLIRKNYAFMLWLDYEKGLYEKVKSDAEKKSHKSLRHPIIGSDRNKQVIEKAKTHAKRAGLQSIVKFEKMNIIDQIPPEGKGIAICNAPYGERLDEKEIEQLYTTIGDSFKHKYEGYDAYLFTGNLKAAKSVGLKTSQKIKLYNGQIECRLFKYEMYRGSKKFKPE